MEPAPTTRTGAAPLKGLAAEDFHPLEMIRYFRRWKQGPVRDVIYTFIWNCSLGAMFWVIAATFQPKALTWGNFIGNVLAANAIGYCIHVFFMIAHGVGLDCRVRAMGAVPIVLYYTGLSTLGVVVGFAVFALAMQPGALRWMLAPRWIALMGFSSLVISVIIATIFFSRERQARAEAELERERSRAERVERQAALANLRALQAQVEPHFLFNTLANVTSLVDADPAMAKRMLESFNRFLRSSLAATRLETTTLGDERDLIAAFLDVLQVRMGARLRYRVDLPAELAAFELPPMLLQPLVENSIRHGLEPKVEGGEVAVSMAREGGHVVIRVEDTGVGFAPTTRGGLGLTNVRDRLRLLYGDRASLVIAEREAGGTRVVVRVPA